MTQEEFEIVEPCQKFILSYRDIDKNVTIDAKKLASHLVETLRMDIYVKALQKILKK